jgi:hypothetical protein
MAEQRAVEPLPVPPTFDTAKNFIHLLGKYYDNQRHSRISKISLFPT